MNAQQFLLFVLAFAVAFFLLRPLIFGGPRISAEEAQAKLAAGTAVLIDVREPAEWARGVAAPALLLPLSDLRGPRAKWGPFLGKNKDRALILYCASGIRSGSAAMQLKKEGFKAFNLGGLGRWTGAGMPTRKA